MDTTSVWKTHLALFLRGHAWGCQFPSLRFHLTGAQLDHAARSALLKACMAACPEIALDVTSTHSEHEIPCGTFTSTAGATVLPNPHPWRTWSETVGWLTTLWSEVQRKTGAPIFEGPRFRLTGDRQATCVLPVHAAASHALLQMVDATLLWLNRHLESQMQPLQANACPTGKDNLTKSIERLARCNPKGSNTSKFIQAAFERGIPMTELPGGVIQYGNGRKARWMDSSLTDVSSTLSTSYCRSKQLTAQMLRAHGLPVPPHALADTVERAIAIAAQLQYPVVVKPADQDGGVGVSAGLETATEVRDAYANAQQFSRKILIEKHIEGRDYRITVLNGKAIWAVERIPGGVTGDGLSSVTQLVEQANQDPRRGKGPHKPLKYLTLDAEALALLKKQGLHAENVPSAGQFVRLRRAANIASGGTPVAVFDRMHPDNAVLAQRAAQAVRIDLAGIDLLIPDIAVSWKISGAAICEVNAQPNIGQITAPHLYGEILSQLIDGNGRIPVIAVIGAHSAVTWCEALKRCYQQFGRHVGYVDASEVTVAHEALTQAPMGVFRGGQLLKLNREVDVVLMAIEDDQIMKTGLPFSRLDAVVIASLALTGNATLKPAKQQARLNELLHTVLAACDGVVVTTEDSPLDSTQFEGITSARRETAPADIETAAHRVVTWVGGGFESAEHPPQ